MKKKLLLLPLLTAFSLVGCSLEDLLGTKSTGANNVTVDQSLETTETGEAEHAGSTYDFNEQIAIENPEDITITETTDEFSISSKDGGVFSQEGNIVKITSAGNLTIYGNKYLIEDMLHIFFENSLKCTGGGNKASYFVVSEGSKRGVEFKFSNTLDKDDETDTKQIMERFYRSPSVKKEGSGIGLSIAQEIINLHKGKIKVDKNNSAISFSITLD